MGTYMAVSPIFTTVLSQSEERGWWDGSAERSDPGASAIGYLRPFQVMRRGEMKCPACGKVLEEMSVANIKVDVCRGGCGGMWFDRFEIQKVDEPHEHEGEGLLDVEIDESITVDHSERRTCPKCVDMIMMRHFFSVRRQVEVDECPKCAGFWLDSGELTRIRRQFGSEEERKRATDEYFSEILAGELGAMRSESQEKLEKARKIAGIFRFISPSYYIRGKQDWGAF
jgi:Zn-finger nucleic acid-binding protein